MNRLAKLAEARAAKVAEVETLLAARQAIIDQVESDKREDLTDEEDVAFRANVAAVREVDLKIADIDEQIRELQDEEERAGRNNAGAQAVAKATAKVTEVREPLTYQKGARDSYFRDLAKTSVGMGDAATAERLRRHSIDVDTNKELRKVAMVGEEYRNLDRNDGSGGYAVPPLWVMNQFIELARAGRPYANLVPGQGLPSGTDSINIPKIATGTSTGIQTADNASLNGPGVNETDLTDTSVQANVKTIAGQQGLAIQLIDQSPINFDEIVFRDLAADYAGKLNVQVISGSGSGNQVVGVRSTAGIVTVTAADTSTETSKGTTIWRKVADAIQRVHTGRFQPAEVIVMHPRRWAAFTAMVDSTGRPLVVPNGAAYNQLGEFGGVVSQQVVGTMHGLPVVTDPWMPTTLGAGTNEDVIHVLRASDLLLFESSVRTRALQETRATNLTVLLQVYGYLAFTAGRQPKSVVEIGGSALTAPLFTA
jgi:HK97 family phage major capsid protein